MSNVASFGFLGSSSPNIAVLGFLGANVPPPPVIVATVPGPSDDDHVQAARAKRQFWDDYTIRLLLLDQ